MDSILLKGGTIIDGTGAAPRHGVDPEEVDSPASYENPAVPPVGIRHVFRNGAIV